MFSLKIYIVQLFGRLLKLVSNWLIWQFEPFNVPKMSFPMGRAQISSPCEGASLVEKALFEGNI